MADRERLEKALADLRRAQQSLRDAFPARPSLAHSDRKQQTRVGDALYCVGLAVRKLELAVELEQVAAGLKIHG